MSTNMTAKITPCNQNEPGARVSDVCRRAISRLYAATTTIQGSS